MCRLLSLPPLVLSLVAVLAAIGCGPPPLTPDGGIEGCDSQFEIRCDLSCVNFVTDPNNCGDCGVVCGEGETCTNGTCTVDVGVTKRARAKSLIQEEVTVLSARPSRRRHLVRKGRLLSDLAGAAKRDDKHRIKRAVKTRLDALIRAHRLRRTTIASYRVRSTPLEGAPRARIFYHVATEQPRAGRSRQFVTQRALVARGGCRTALTHRTLRAEHSAEHSSEGKRQLLTA